jgi:hypothetical protein
MAIIAGAEIAALADHLAALRGQSVETVVATALRSEISRELGATRTPSEVTPIADRSAKIARILEMVRAAGPAGGAHEDRTAFLYDDQGLPA